jgi:hypothetical protein
MYSKVLKILKEKFPEYKIIDIFDEFMSLKTFYHPYKNSIVINFDKVFIVTNDMDYNPSYNITYQDAQEKKIKPDNIKYYWIIVDNEANITIRYLHKKIEEIVDFQECLEISREVKDENYDHMEEVTQWFKYMNDIIKFYNFEFEIYLFLNNPYNTYNKRHENEIEYIFTQAKNPPNEIETYEYKQSKQYKDLIYIKYQIIINVVK